MKIPKTVKIGPFDYSIKMVKVLENMGETHNDDLAIKLNKALKAQVMEETFVHELCHAINHVYCNRELDEGEIRQLSLGVYQVFKDNGFLKEK